MRRRRTTPSADGRDPQADAFCQLLQTVPRSADRVDPAGAVAGPTRPPGHCNRWACLPQRRPILPQYFVAVGTLEPRKNLSMLLRIWTDARADGAPLPALRLIGQRGWITRANSDTDRLLSHLRPDVVHLPGLADAALVEQVSGARALLLPTQAEGWGLPLAEACALGVPAIASDLPALREAAQGRAKFLAPDDPEIWATTIRHYTAPASPRHAAAVSALYDYRPPTWKAHFQKLDALLRK